MITLEDDPLWFKDAIVYEVHVRAFQDSNDDGIGDFQGLTDKLAYIEDLGMTAIWLLPFYPSPLKDDGYDIADCFNVHPDYGRLRDFKEFLREAHRRGIRVITELVLNHTSDQHLWFRRSRRSGPGSYWRDFYIWSDTPDQYKDARVIFKDFETSNWAWDPVAGSYYFHRFYAHQPDLNFDNPHVRQMMFRVIDFWMEMGVDGLRLDAVPYLFKREGTNCENLPETYAFLKKVRTHVDSKFKNRMLLAEANQWPEDAAAYFGSGDMCHMAFHFPLMPRIFIGLQMEDRFPIVDILEQTPAIPESCQWALFLRNHDELTLEMVTDQERDYMYRVYATDPHARINVGIRRRLAPLLDNDRMRIELIYAILFSLPGTPFIYYGNEIGMGDNYYLGDRNGVRTPMQWSPDRNAGFSKANPQKLYLPVVIDPEYHYESINVENQQRNPSSFLWWMKRAIAVRKKLKTPGRGTMEFLFPENPKILAFIRKFEEETILVVANLSKYFQVAELDLSKYVGVTPQTAYSQTKFPVIREVPYVFTLGPHNYIWLLLKKAEETLISAGERAVPELRTTAGWASLFAGRRRERLENDVLPKYLTGCRWFGAKASSIREVAITESIPVTEGPDPSYLLFLEVTFVEGSQEVYLLPVSFMLTGKVEQGLEGSVAEGSSDRPDDERTVRSKMIMEESPESIIARLYLGADEGLLYDATYDDAFRKALLAVIAKRKKIRGRRGELVGHQGKTFKRILDARGVDLPSQKLRAEQSNTSVAYEDRLYFKLFRNIREGINPDQEIVQFLTERTEFRSIAPFLGSIEYRRNGSGSIAIGLLQELVSNEGDGWTYTQDAVRRYFESVLSKAREIKDVPKVPFPFFNLDLSRVAPVLQELIEGHYVEMMALLGERTGEMHLALASVPDEQDFAPEPFSLLYQRSVFQSMRTLLRRVLLTLRNRISTLPESVQQEAPPVLQSEQAILNSLQQFMSRKFSSMRIRIHGDYHLGQVLYTGKDFVIIDFEGEPARELSERRLKHSPFKDVAGMVRSFHYAAYTALFRDASVRPEDALLLQPWTDIWYRYVAAIFLKSYFDTVKERLFVPADATDIEIMLKAYLLEKAIYELGYELNNRPEWVIAPLKGIRDLVEGG
jgi:maltose alpha-D-glucosyltransferase / alpha-amylase